MDGTGTGWVGWCRGEQRERKRDGRMTNIRKQKRKKEWNKNGEKWNERSARYEREKKRMSKWIEKLD